jgi:predicted DNA binding CopG/RHH family protein
VEEKMSHLPTTDSITELAAFWQTHDPTDYEDELIQVSEPVFHHAERISVRLAAEDISALRKTARRERVSEADLLSRWVHERLSAKEKSPTSR